MEISRLVLLLCCTISCLAPPATASPELVAPGFIQAFSYDIAVHARNVTIGDVVELFVNNETNPITAQVITSTQQSSETSTLIFNCGYFFQTGIYFFKLRSPEGKELASSQPVIVEDRPKVTIDWEKRHQALTTDVKVTLKVKGGICKSDIARESKLLLKLTKISNKTENATDIIIDTFSIMESTETFIPSYFVLPCEKFSNAGMYKTSLILSPQSGDDVILSNSDVMKVEWSKDYDLKLLKHSFPCTGTGVTVALSFPPCASRYDAVRLTSVSNGIKKVIAEISRDERDHVTFPCSAFYSMNTTVDGFCFQYVAEGGYVARTVCEPVSEKSQFNMSGSWSPWSSWSTCERPCQKAVKRKKRVCENPRPYGDGKRCTDNSGQDSLEELVIRESSMSWSSCDDYVMTSSEKQECDCGCSLQTEERGVIVSSLTDSCDNAETLIWTASVPPSHVILFKLSDYQLTRDEVLTIRDGRKSWPMTSQFPSVMSQGNTVIIQWVKSKEKNDLKSCGFILSFEAVVKPTSAFKSTTTPLNINSTNVDIGDWIEKTISRNPVVLAGIGSCIVIIAIVIIVFISVRCKKRKQEGKNAKIPPGLRTPMNNRLAVPPDGRSCSNADDTESEPMVRPRPIGNAGTCDVIADTCILMQSSVATGTAYYLAQRQLELMRRLGKDEHSQTYATGCLSEEALRQQEDLLFGDNKSVCNNEELKVT